MSRPLGLARPLALLIAVLVLSLTTVSVAPASASDKTLISAVVSADKQLRRTVASVDREVPEDEKSATYAADLTAVLAKYDAAFARYSDRIAAERGSTSAGRKGRKLIVKSVVDVRSYYTLSGAMQIAKVAGTEPTQEQLDEADRLWRSSQTSQKRGYALLNKIASKSSKKQGKAAAR